ncbi:MAG: hypothetical protein QOD02_1878, partial [Mycobacterium sp.]|nr:hypothetical protein [Mycobacterium sp.]
SPFIRTIVNPIKDKAKSFQQWAYYCLDIGGELGSHRYFPPT